MVKNEREIRCLRESAALNWETLCEIREILVEGVSEAEIAQKYIESILNRGATGVAFPPIIAFGESSAEPHHIPGDRKLKKGDVVLLDVGLIWKGYCSDVTRTFLFGDRADFRFETIVRQAHSRALKMCRPGVDFAEIGKMVDDFFQEMKVFEFRKHNLGHGIGKEVHEPPFVKSEDRILQAGMCITIEPGLYDSGNFGYRHEDTIVITKEGYENFYENGNWTR